jgi:hypothetical protein
VASPKTPLMTAIAQCDDWSGGWLRLRMDGRWPIEITISKEMTENINGKRGWVGRRFTMRAIERALAGGGELNLARGAKLLATDPADVKACGEIAEMLTAELYKNDLGGVGVEMTAGWSRLADGFWISDEPDPIKAAKAAYMAAHGIKWDEIARIDATPDDDAHEIDDDPDGVVIIPRIGGTSATTQAKEAQAEFGSMAGVHLPLMPAPDVEKTRAVLVEEFPHAAAMIDILLTDIVGKESAKFKPTIIVGPSGCGKSRLVRRLGEVCGLYVGRYDAAAAGRSPDVARRRVQAPERRSCEHGTRAGKRVRKEL